MQLIGINKGPRGQHLLHTEGAGSVGPKVHSAVLIEVDYVLDVPTTDTHKALYRMFVGYTNTSHVMIKFRSYAWVVKVIGR